jgi:hypothetical protein
MKLTTEKCSVLDIHALARATRKIVERNNPETTSTALMVLIEAELKKFSVNDQRFEYTCSGGHYGLRWSFVCPKCHNTCTKLFLPPTLVADKEHLYLCKRCHKLKNMSELGGTSKMYRVVLKPMKRLKEIEAKIAKGHLKQEDMVNMLNEYERVEAEIRDTPEYRLYQFKQKHGLIWWLKKAFLRRIF